MLIKFQCNNSDCSNEITKLFTKKNQVPGFLDCAQCGTGKLERILSVPSSKSTQVVDNGAQARAVEVMNEVVLKEQERQYRESND